MKQCILRPILLLFVLVMSGCYFPGQAYINAQVLNDGKLILQTGFGVPDSMGNKETFRELEGKPFAPQNGWKPADSASKTVTLNGKLIVKVSHTDRPRAEVQIDELKLERAESGGSWKLAPGEVDRLYKLIK